ncbi:hypothetical protein G7Y89_g8816 [Cudoniella acicularis]|uniref:Uncharacterized protein n=1 Tax=Cudoniella acicularis TaxID=354080 RepID=A0A8H4RJL1_9HELO|nr:hypothetical protein G7Y89_g8816 [Cudoniella acicularis]
MRTELLQKLHSTPLDVQDPLEKFVLARTPSVWPLTAEDVDRLILLGPMNNSFHTATCCEMTRAEIKKYWDNYTTSCLHKWPDNQGYELRRPSGDEATWHRDENGYNKMGFDINGLDLDGNHYKGEHLEIPGIDKPISLAVSERGSMGGFLKRASELPGKEIKLLCFCDEDVKEYGEKGDGDESKGI